MQTMTAGGFGPRLEQARQALGLSKYRVAKDAKLNESYYGKLERGAAPPPSDDVLSDLAPVLGVDFDQLKAWADADRLGDEGLERLKRYVLDYPEDQLPEGGLDLTESEIDDIVGAVMKWPKDRRDVFVRKLAEVFVAKTKGK